MKKFKWLLQVCFLAVFASLFTAVLPQTARADFAERPVGFVVIDQDGGVDGAVYKQWRQMVRLAYRFPDYRIIDGGEPQMLVSQAVRDGVKPDAASLAALAEKSKTDVLVVARIYEMDETLVSGWGMRFDKIINSGFTGETNNTSIVPVSFSRTMEIEVIMAQISIRIKPITPGTKL